MLKICILCGVTVYFLRFEEMEDIQKMLGVGEVFNDNIGPCLDKAACSVRTGGNGDADSVIRSCTHDIEWCVTNDDTIRKIEVPSGNDFKTLDSNREEFISVLMIAAESPGREIFIQAENTEFYPCALLKVPCQQTKLITVAPALYRLQGIDNSRLQVLVAALYLSLKMTYIRMGYARDEAVG